MCVHGRFLVAIYWFFVLFVYKCHQKTGITRSKVLIMLTYILLSVLVIVRIKPDLKPLSSTPRLKVDVIVFPVKICR